MAEIIRGVPALAKVLGLLTTYRSAYFSIKRSICCASPGRRKLCKYFLRAGRNSRFVKSIMSTKACIVLILNSSLRRGKKERERIERKDSGRRDHHEMVNLRSTKILSDVCLVQALSVKEEGSDVSWIFIDDLVAQKEFHSLQEKKERG